MGSPGQEASELPSRARRYMPFMDGQYVLSALSSTLGAALSIVAASLIPDVSDMDDSKALHHEIQKS